MSGNYIPLYRKYRPQTIEMLVGQEHIKKTLTGAIELGKISHAYLFTGPRGTGKTSTARILAKSLNCKNGPTIHPCGECESCKDIISSIPIDVIEIDAASNRKVEDAQNILEKVQYVPVNGKYKIYIIDEVHMLSTHAFNALLKTLEEPPENVIFILATTEVHKVPDTIKSRCQRFDFRRITTDDIVNHLKYISAEENIKITDDALFSIAKNSAGGMRDSISLLDQLSILGAAKEISVDDVNSIIGRLSFDVLHEISQKIISSSPSEAIEILNRIYNSGNEPLQILTNINEYFKNLLIAKTCSNNLLPELTGLNGPQIKELTEQSNLLETQQIVFLIERISYYIKEVKLAVNQHLWLEVGIIDLANLSENSTLLDLQNRIKALEEGTALSETPLRHTAVKKVEEILTPNESVKQTSIRADNTKIKQQKTEEILKPQPIPQKSDSKDTETLWQALLSRISSPPTQAMLRLATPVKISKEEVIITFKNDKFVSQINDSNKKQLIQEAANELFETNSVAITIKPSSASDTMSQSVQKKQQPEKIQQSEKNEYTSEKLVKTTPYNLNKSLPQNEQKAQPPAERGETDQEKMILDLFDGKYVE